MNATCKETYHIFFNGFCTSSARGKHYEYCRSNGGVKVKMHSQKENWLKFHYGQYQFKVPFLLYSYSESILKSLDQKNRRKMNHLKIEWKDKDQYTEKIKTYVHCMKCTQHFFVYCDVFDPLKMYRGKDYAAKLVEHIKSEVTRFDETLPQ